MVREAFPHWRPHRPFFILDSQCVSPKRHHANTRDRHGRNSVSPSDLYRADIDRPPLFYSFIIISKTKLSLYSCNKPSKSLCCCSFFGHRWVQKNYRYVSWQYLVLLSAIHVIPLHRTRVTVTRVCVRSALLVSPTGLSFSTSGSTSREDNFAEWGSSEGAGLRRESECGTPAPPLGAQARADGISHEVCSQDSARLQPEQLLLSSCINFITKHICLHLV